MVAGVVTVTFFYAAAPVFGVRAGNYAPLLARGLGIEARATPALALGIVALLVVAVAWGLLYAAIRGSIPGPDWAVGLGFGLAVWLVGRYLLLPVIGIPATTGSVVLSLAENLVFGLVLGLLTPRIRFKSV